ncbi:flagellar export chaperone FliS [Gallaecimonas sp. GXIMD4217]|uniref:flagellar export chaperone FliS n=1 Tax=Gallaecimonas sp. GXIMD4217 TaxID=3131927 RepID=UPI00311B0ED1
MVRGNARQYQQVSKQSSLASADPHRVILALMQGALESMNVAKGAMQRQDFEVKAKAINKTIRIVGGLQDGLDIQANPEIGENFYNLYDYIIRRLGEASVSMDESIIDELQSLLAPIAEAWAQIPDEAKQQAAVQRQGQP